MRQRVGSWFIDRFVPFLFPRINPLIRRLLKSRAHWILSWYVVLLLVPGRRSGRVYEVPLAYHRGAKGSIEALTSPNGQWWKNLRGAEGLTIIFKGRRVDSARLELVEDDQEAKSDALARRDIGRRFIAPLPPELAVLVRVWPEAKG